MVGMGDLALVVVEEDLGAPAGAHRRAGVGVDGGRKDLGEIGPLDNLVAGRRQAVGRFVGLDQLLVLGVEDRLAPGHIPKLQLLARTPATTTATATRRLGGVTAASRECEARRRRPCRSEEPAPR